MANIEYSIKGKEQLGLRKYKDKEQLIELGVVCGFNRKWLEENVVETDTDSEEYILKNIPKELHAALSYMAYERGHAYGESEVRINLMDLVEGLEKPIKEFEKNIREEYS